MGLGTASHMDDHLHAEGPQRGCSQRRPPRAVPRRGCVLSAQDGCGTAGPSRSLTQCGAAAPPTPPASLSSAFRRSTVLRAPSRKGSVVGTRGPERRAAGRHTPGPGAGSSARQQAGARGRGAGSPHSPTPTRPYFPKLPRGETWPGYVRRAEKPMCAF